jgi:hypothetical protein
MYILEGGEPDLLYVFATTASSAWKGVPLGPLKNLSPSTSLRSLSYNAWHLCEFDEAKPDGLVRSFSRYVVSLPVKSRNV